MMLTHDSPNIVENFIKVSAEDKTFVGPGVTDPGPRRPRGGLVRRPCPDTPVGRTRSRQPLRHAWCWCVVASEGARPRTSSASRRPRRDECYHLAQSEVQHRHARCSMPSGAHGVEPRIVLYAETPPSEREIRTVLKQAKLSARDLLRRKGTPYEELGSR